MRSIGTQTFLIVTLYCAGLLFNGCSSRSNDDAAKATPNPSYDSFAESDERHSSDAPANPLLMQGAEPQAARSGEPFSMVRIFYGTNRKRNYGERNPQKVYTAKLGTLEFGYCEVSIPDKHEYGEVERPSLWKLEFRENSKKHVMLQSVQPVSTDEFGSRLSDSVARSDSGEVLIFVHGFNVSFAEASYRTAQITHDLSFDGAPVMYSWPSHGSVARYPSDISHADASESKFIEFLETVAAKSNARQIHLVAHSMGNRLVTSSLRQLGEESVYRQIPKLNEVILAAPDVDANTFKELVAPQILNASNRVTIYASSTDRALQASKLIHQGPRLGLGGNNLVSFPRYPKIQVVDATGLDLGMLTLGHSTYGDELLGDMSNALDGDDPKQRHLKPHLVQAAWQITNPSQKPVTTPAVRTASSTKVKAKPVKQSLWSRVRFWR